MVLPKVLLARWGDGAQERALTLFLISAHAVSVEKEGQSNLIDSCLPFAVPTVVLSQPGRFIYSLKKSVDF